MDENLFKNWEFIYENSDDITFGLVYISPDGKYAPFSLTVTTDEIRSHIGGKTLQFELGGDCFCLVVHAVKDNEVYLTLLERSAEHARGKPEHYLLNKKVGRMGKALVFHDIPVGQFVFFVKEWGGVKRGIVI